MKKKNALIAGHRGPGTGAVGYIDEGAETIWMRDRIEDFLCTKYNIIPLVDNENATLNEVVKKLRTELRKEDICIDIHFNSFLDPKANGCEVLVPKNQSDDERQLAAELVVITSDLLGIKMRGVKPENSGQHSGLAMLSGFDCCNVVWEICFVSNKDDSEKYMNKREELAEAIADLIFKKVM